MNATIIKLAAIAAMVFTPVLAMAQWKVGVEGGVVINTMLVSKCYDYDRHYTGGTNGIIGIPIRYDFRDWFGLQAYARFSFGGPKVRGYLLAGGFLGAWLDSYVEGYQMRYFLTEDFSYSAYHFDEKVPFDSRRDNRFDAGVSGAIGVEYQFAKRFSVFVEGRYLYSLTDMQKEYMMRQPSKHNSTFAFQTGFIYTITTK